MTDMTYEKALESINSLLAFGSRPGLERIGELLKRLGNPQDRLKFVHIAGTNGKGSVCNIIANVLAECGLKTGFFISPYVLDFRERIQINGEYISKEELCRITEMVMPVVHEMAKENLIITEFELITVIGFIYFAESGCDIVVLETGLGGRFDATNIINSPLCSVITSISLDHTAVLGNSLEKIAFEKCGIIKDSCPVCFFPQEKEVNAVVEKTASERKSRLYYADKEEIKVLSSGICGTKFIYKNKEIYLPLMGKHQIKNAQTALACLKALKDVGIKITDEALKSGFQKVYMPARLEVLSKNPLVILDGAHNPGGMTALSETLRQNTDKEIIFVMGMLKDKDAFSSLEHLKGLGKTVITLTPSNPRKQTAQELAQKALNFFPDVFPMDNYEEAITKALDLVGADKALVICGSLYLASELRPIILRHLKQICDN